MSEAPVGEDEANAQSLEDEGLVRHVLQQDDYHLLKQPLETDTQGGSLDSVKETYTDVLGNKIMEEGVESIQMKIRNMKKDNLENDEIWKLCGKDALIFGEFREALGQIVSIKAARATAMSKLMKPQEVLEFANALFGEMKPALPKELPDRLERRVEPLWLAKHGLGKTVFAHGIDREKKDVRVVTEKYLKSKETRGKGGIMAVWASTGSGKSHAGDEVAIKAIESGCHAVLVTYNSVQFEITPQEMVEDTKVALCCRVLFSMFNFGKNFGLFRDVFLKHKDHGRLLNVVNLEEAYRNHQPPIDSKTGIFFVVDEIRLADGMMYCDRFCTRAKAVYYAMVQLLGNERNGLMISTLDSEPIATVVLGDKWATSNLQASASRRPIDWVHLPKLTSAEIVQLIQDLVATRSAALRRIFEWLRGLCGGHPRNLVFLVELSFSLENEASLSATSLFRRLREYVMKIIKPLAQGSVGIAKIFLAHSVLNMEVKAGTDAGTLMKCGWLVGDGEPCIPFIPQVSLFALSHFCENPGEAARQEAEQQQQQEAEQQQQQEAEQQQQEAEQQQQQEAEQQQQQEAEQQQQQEQEPELDDDEDDDEENENEQGEQDDEEDDEMTEAHEQHVEEKEEGRKNVLDGRGR